MYSKASIRFVLDTLHLILTEQLDLYVLVEVLDYLHYEGKTKLSLFEKRLAENLMTTLITKKLPISTQILLCLAISTIDNYDDTFEKSVGTTLTQVMDFNKFHLKLQILIQNPSRQNNIQRPCSSWIGRVKLTRPSFNDALTRD